METKWSQEFVGKTGCSTVNEKQAPVSFSQVLFVINGWPKMLAVSITIGTAKHKSMLL